MFIAYAVVTVITIAANVGSAWADFMRVGFVLSNSAEVGVPPSWIPWLATLKSAGAAGLLLGLVGVPLIGIAAAASLTLFFIGALAVHFRARVFYNIAYPGTYFALAVASLTLASMR